MQKLLEQMKKILRNGLLCYVPQYTPNLNQPNLKNHHVVTKVSVPTIKYLTTNDLFFQSLCHYKKNGKMNYGSDLLILK